MVPGVDERERLEDVLKKNRWACPSCGNAHPKAVESKGISLAGNRFCENCGCSWSPGCSKAWGVLAAVLLLPIGVVGSILCLYGIFHGSIGVLGGFALAASGMSVYGGVFGVSVLVDRRGALKIIDTPRKQPNP